jgi:hypothetical protein
MTENEIRNLARKIAQVEKSLEQIRETFKNEMSQEDFRELKLYDYVRSEPTTVTGRIRAIQALADSVALYYMGVTT